MSTTSSAPADWHPDPEGSGYRRYWDGQAWGALETGDFSAFAPDAVHPATSGYYPDPQNPSQRRAWDGHAWGELESSAPPPPATSLYTPPERVRMDANASAAPYRPGEDALPPPGVYPDPNDPTRERYWNGTSWNSPHYQERTPGEGLFGTFGLYFAKGSRTRTPLLAGCAVLVLLLGYMAFSPRGSGPPSTASSTTTTAVVAVNTPFCTHMRAYNAFEQANPNSVTFNTALWSTRADVLAGVAAQLTFLKSQIGIVTDLISSAPSPDIHAAWTSNQYYNQHLETSLTNAQTYFLHVSPQLPRARIQKNLYTFVKRVIYNIAGGKDALVPVAQAISLACPQLSAAG